MSQSLKMKLMNKPIPAYSKGEEIFNWVSHLIGVVVGLFALSLFISKGIMDSYPPLWMASLIFYSVSMMVLYACSTIYHFISPDSPYKRVFRLIDHNTIYILIAGTYAPLCAIAFPGTNWGIIMLSIELICLIIGMTFNFVGFHNKFVKVFTVILYVVMGWLAAFCFPALMMLDFTTRMLILMGGVAYTVGVIFYAVGKSKKWMHSVFHLFVLAGTIIQLFGIFTMLNLF